MIMPNWMGAIVFCLLVVSAVLEAINASWAPTLLWLFGALLWLVASFLNDRAEKLSAMSALSALIYSLVLADITLIWILKDNQLMAMMNSGPTFIFALAAVGEYRGYRVLKKRY